ncbi:hypothetical protein P154DRAFT_461731 [Amniculicola lignicola CBS 123094]|uniref:Uncharacterized protein n=1 Tax=Amniculicola lignicola CBS 123094 TaxID=1392246 RepID=A0A6A5WZ24_9PLEO|nr:hypothetical protein P154DRAFT_461731 [Amniculicola lignicola CBS 123094]
MLDVHKDDGPESKFYFTHSLLPSYIDPNNTSTKKKPFDLFQKQPFSHTVDLILPEEIYELVRAQFEDGETFGTLQYARVHMKLGEMLAEEFLEHYVKKGSIMMLSEGRPLVDNVFSLYKGQLRIELDRATYERCGIQGKPIENGGKKHQKARWVIELDLCSKNMKHGKKGFSRLEWACNNVLDQSLTWLFYNPHPNSIEALPDGREPIAMLQPFVHRIAPTANVLERGLAPEITVAHLANLYDQDSSLALLEWLHMMSLPSPRLQKSDRIDPYLSRYEVPDLGHGLATKNIVCVRWNGFISPEFIKGLFLTVRRHGMRVAKDDQDGEGGTEKMDEGRWFSITAKAFGGYGGCYTVMQFAGRETFTWVCD